MRGDGGMGLMGMTDRNFSLMRVGASRWRSIFPRDKGADAVAREQNSYTDARKLVRLFGRLI